MIIDFRVRPPMRSFLQLGIHSDAFLKSELRKVFGPPTPSMLERSMPKLLDELRGAGVSHSLIWGRAVHNPKESTSNDDIAAIIAEHRGYFSGLGGVCVRGNVADAVREVDNAIKNLGMKGITVEPGFHEPPIYADDPKLYPVYARCAELGGILAFTISALVGHDLSHCSPVALDRVAADFPNLKIVVSHACWPWVTQACGVAFRRPNVYLMPDLYGLAMPGYLQFVEAANSYLGERLLFGTAYPVAGIQFMVDGYTKLPYRDEVREKVMYANAAKLLGLR